MTTTLPRVAPVTLIADAYAEQACVASALLSPADLDQVLAVVTADAFTAPSCATLLGVLADLRDARAPISVTSVALELRRRGRADLADDLPALMKQGQPGAALYFARKVAQTASLRALADVGLRIHDLAQRGADADEAAAEALGLVQAVVEAGAQRTDLVPLSDTMDRLWARLNSGVVPGLPTGFRDLDGLTGGMHPGQLILLGARPGSGKTALAMGIAESVARRGVPVLFVSMEMGDDQLGGRLVAMVSGLDGQQIRMNALAPADLARAATAIGDLAALPITVWDVSSLTIDQLRARARAWRTTVRGDALVVVDYLQLMSAPGARRDGRVVEVSAISRGLKNLARELRAPVLALSQLSRAVEGRTVSVPMLSDLRESGSLEQDADTVWFIYREEMNNPDSDKKGVAELHVAKQREGPVGVAPLRYDAPTTRFSDLSYRGIDGY